MGRVSPLLNGASRWLDRGLQLVTLTLMIALALVVIVAVAFRYSGHSLIWYDELASLMLAWLTFLGAALAALRNAHLGFNGLLYALPMGPRIGLFVLVEILFFATFAVIGWAGYRILDIFGGESLISLPFISRSVAQSVLPIGAGLVLLARAVSLAERLEELRLGLDPEEKEIRQEIARAGGDPAHGGRKGKS